MYLRIGANLIGIEEHNYSVSNDYMGQWYESWTEQVFFPIEHSHNLFNKLKFCQCIISKFDLLLKIHPPPEVVQATKPYLSASNCLSSRLSIGHYMAKLPFLLLGLDGKECTMLWTTYSFMTKKKLIYLREFPPRLHRHRIRLMTFAALLCGNISDTFLGLLRTCNLQRCIISY